MLQSFLGTDPLDYLFSPVHTGRSHLEEYWTLKTKDQGDYITAEVNVLGAEADDVVVYLTTEKLTIEDSEKNTLVESDLSYLKLDSKSIKKSYFKMKGGVLKVFIQKPQKDIPVRLECK